MEEDICVTTFTLISSTVVSCGSSKVPTPVLQVAFVIHRKMRIYIPPVPRCLIRKPGLLQVACNKKKPWH